jgi:2-polyprenyl-3-methyl-5-hydroxy-6-metoxy-1,4-benzoquinol methylase
MPRYEPMERLKVARPVSRNAFVRDVCRGKIVLDLGAMDETAYLSKRGTGMWLHEAIASVAAQVTGVDSSDQVPEGGLRTAPNAVIHRGDIMQLASWFEAHNPAPLPDVVVAGEVIEHVPNPLAFLRELRSIERLRGRKLVITTPNATAAHNVMIALLSRESTHHDHLCILSYKTLHTLFHRAGFTRWSVTPYYADFPEMRSRHTGLLGTAIGIGEKGVNVVEWLFPLLSFGYIVEAEL